MQKARLAEESCHHGILGTSVQGTEHIIKSDNFWAIVDRSCERAIRCFGPLLRTVLPLPIRVWSPSSRRSRSRSSAQARNVTQYHSTSYSAGSMRPQIALRIVVSRSHGVCTQRPIRLVDTDIVPPYETIFPKTALNKFVWPEPTGPIVIVKDPHITLRLTFRNAKSAKVVGRRSTCLMRIAMGSLPLLLTICYRIGSISTS